MAVGEVLSAAETRLAIDRKLDELDRALLGLLPRAERLAVVADVEARLQALGDGLVCVREAAQDSTAVVPAATPVARRLQVGARRSRLAFSAGVLGIVAAACLVISPLLFIVLSMVGELLGEFVSIALLGMFAVLLVGGGCYAVLGGGVSLFRLASRRQTGTGWAITGLATGMLPMLLGFVGVLSLGAELLPNSDVEVTWNATPAGPVPYQVASQPAIYSSPGSMPSPYDPAPMLAPPGVVPSMPMAMPPSFAPPPVLPSPAMPPAAMPAASAPQMLPPAPTSQPTTPSLAPTTKPTATIPPPSIPPPSASKPEPVSGPTSQVESVKEESAAVED